MLKFFNFYSQCRWNKTRVVRHKVVYCREMNIISGLLIACMLSANLNSVCTTQLLKQVPISTTRTVCLRDKQLWSMRGFILIALALVRLQLYGRVCQTRLRFIRPHISYDTQPKTLILLTDKMQEVVCISRRAGLLELPGTKTNSNIPTDIHFGVASLIKLRLQHVYGVANRLS